MGFVDIILYSGIAIMYNLFVHNLASITYKDLQYEEKNYNTIIMIILFGGFGILIAKLLHEKYKQYDNPYVTNGLFYGGVLLILTSLFANWDAIAQEMRFILITAIFGVLIWYGYKRNTAIVEKKEEEGKLNEAVITKLINEEPSVPKKNKKQRKPKQKPKHKETMSVVEQVAAQ